MKKLGFLVSAAAYLMSSTIAFAATAPNISAESKYIESQRKIYQMSDNLESKDGFNAFYYVEMKTQLKEAQEILDQTPAWKFSRKQMLQDEIEKIQSKIASTETELSASKNKDIIVALKTRDESLSDLLKTKTKPELEKSILSQLPSNETNFQGFVSKSLKDETSNFQTK